MKRPIPLPVLALAAALLVLLPGAAPAATDAAAPGEELARPITLRGQVTVSEPLVRLGDLFHGAGDKAAVPVAYAPQPGSRAVFDARWLYRVARAHGLDWRPASIRERVVVERDSQVVGAEQIRERILTALDERGADTGDAEVDLDNRMLRLYLPLGASPELAVEDLAYDAGRGRFAAVLAVAGEGGGGQRVRVTGRVRRMAEVPVPARRIRPGEVISAGDLSWKRLASNRLQRDVVTSAEQLIGLTPRRGLREGVPVRASDVQRPRMIAKGELVTVTLSTANMTLTARGVALQDGSKGEAIRVSNLHSRQVIEAVVTGPGRVGVLGAGAPWRN